MSLGTSTWRLGMALCGVSLGLVVLALCSAYSVQDDAYMFVRYADHLLEHGALAWHPGGEPAYGTTSLLYLTLVVPMRGILPGSAVCAAMGSSLLAGAAFLVLLWRMLAGLPDASTALRRAVTLVAFATIAFAARRTGVHFVSGMDTSFALVLATCVVLAWQAYERKPGDRRAVLVGAVGVAAWLTRPDMALFALGPPAWMLLFPGAARARRHAALALGVSAAGIALTALAAWLYFGTPVPLPFYAKGTSRVYSEAFIERYRPTAMRHFRIFVGHYGIFLAPVLLEAILRPRALIHDSAPWERGLLAAVGAFLVYYLFFVVQVVSLHQRFYHPALPAIFWLGGRSATRWIAALPEAWGAALARAPRALRIAGALALLGVLCWPIARGLRELRIETGAGRTGTFDIVERYRQRSSRFWLGLEQLAGLPDDLVVATTEVGHPAVMLPGKIVVDLAGLNETQYALHGFSGEHLLATYRPDFVYMPHPDYPLLNSELHENPTFQAEYELFPAAELNAFMAVALDREGPHYEALREIVLEEAAAGSVE